MPRRGPALQLFADASSSHQFAFRDSSRSETFIALFSCSMSCFIWAANTIPAASWAELWRAVSVAVRVAVVFAVLIVRTRRVRRGCCPRTGFRGRQLFFQFFLGNKRPLIQREQQPVGIGIGRQTEPLAQRVGQVTGKLPAPLGRKIQTTPHIGRQGLYQGPIGLETDRNLGRQSIHQGVLHLGHAAQPLPLFDHHHRPAGKIAQPLETVVHRSRHQPQQIAERQSRPPAERFAKRPVGH